MDDALGVELTIGRRSGRGRFAVAAGRARTRTIGLALLLLLAAVPASAQSLPIDTITPALPTAGERHAADIASWATALTAVALDARASFDCPDRRRCLERQGERLAIVYGSAFAAKVLVHRRRPCAPDCGIDNPDRSFFSAHTAVAFSTLGGPRLAFALPLSISTGGLRIAAGKHWLTDTLAGAAVGSLASRLRP